MLSTKTLSIVVYFIRVVRELNAIPPQACEGRKSNGKHANSWLLLMLFLFPTTKSTSMLVASFLAFLNLYLESCLGRLVEVPAGLRDWGNKEQTRRERTIGFLLQGANPPAHDNGSATLIPKERRTEEGAERKYEARIGNYRQPSYRSLLCCGSLSCFCWLMSQY
jgi:hypothetical protein